MRLIRAVTALPAAWLPLALASFVAGGGVVQFARRQNRVRIRVNLDATERARLEFRSHLLKIAVVNRGKGGHGIPG